MYRRTHLSPSSMDRLMTLCSIPNISPVQQKRRNRDDENDHQRYSYNDRRYLFNRCTEQPGGRRCSTTPNHDRYNSTDNSLVIEALAKISNNFNPINRQPLVTAVLSAMKEFDDTNKSSTIPWLDQVELEAVRSSTNPIDIGISKLVGIPLRSMITIKHKEGNLTWCRFQQVLIENYSDVPYVSDGMSCYMKMTKGEEESITQYLVRAKTYLERINHISNLSNMKGGGLNQLLLAQGIKDSYIKQREAKEAENWRPMGDAFNSMSKHARAVERTKAYHEPRYNDITTINTI